MVPVWLLVAQAPPAEIKPANIVYVVDKAEASDLYLAKGDGSGRKLLVKNGDMPSWSPDRKRVAFVRGAEIWTINMDGTRAARAYAAPSGSFIEALDWGFAPGDAKKWALSFSIRNERGVTPYLMPTGAEAAVLKVGDGYFRASERGWATVSPSARSMAFSLNGDLWLSYLDDNEWQTTRIAAVAHIDQAQRRSSVATKVVREISWVPNARKLVYFYSRFGGSGVEQLWLFDFSLVRDPLQGTSGAKRTVLVDGAMDPSVSASGKWVLYSRVAGGIAVTSLDGKRKFRVIQDGRDGDW